MPKKDDIFAIEGLSELMKKGKKTGTISYAEIMDALQNVDLDPEQIEPRLRGASRSWN